MKIELISPAVDENAPLPNLALPILARLTPPDVEISYTDDLLTPIHLEKDLKEVDLVGITVMSKTALRAYQISLAYRRKGIPVVLGGIHPTALPEEACQHADSVVIGEAEEVWPHLVDDARSGRLKAVYQAGGLTDPAKIPRPRREILPRKGYFPVDLIQVSRGCPYRCEFCSVHRFFGDTYRFRPISDVIEEIKTLRKPLIIFNDDNIFGHPAYSKDLLKAMIPLRRRWVGQISLSALRDANHVDLMVKSGCKGLLIGFESLSRETLARSCKVQNDPAEYREIIDRLHRSGIAIWGAFIFGFDEDSPSVFEATVAFAIRSKLFSAAFAILTPYPETPLYHRLRKEGRLVKDPWWLLESPDESAPHFLPVKMSPEILREGWKKAWRDFYDYPSILRRFQWNYPPTLTNRLIYFPFQWMQHRFTQKKIVEGRQRFRKRIQ